MALISRISLAVLMTIALASMQFHPTVAQTSHVVGDALGWTIPPGGAAAYTTWASQQTFAVGDVLIFNFANGEHDVAEVTSEAYGPCTSTNPISLNTTGPALLTLTTARTHYYICTFTSHCQIGQKLTINVAASTTAPPPSTTPTTSPPTTTPASPPPTATPTPPGEPCPPTSSPTSSPLSPPTITTGSTGPPSLLDSGARSFTVMLPVTFLAIGLVFLNH